MPEITGLCIPADPTQPIKLVRFDPHDARALPALVGGYLEVIHQPEPPATFWVHEEGIVHGLAVNSRATALVQAFTCRWAACPYLRGTVVLTGHPHRSGAPTSVPEELQTLLLRARFFKIEIRTRGSDEWASNAMLFTDWFSAANFVISMGLRWPEVIATRIAPTQPVPWPRNPTAPGT
jgi:hypothetical protein